MLTCYGEVVGLRKTKNGQYMVYGLIDNGGIEQEVTAEFNEIPECLRSVDLNKWANKGKVFAFDGVVYAGAGDGYKFLSIRLIKD